jgi:hypothetical protein
LGVSAAVAAAVFTAVFALGFLNLPPVVSPVVFCGAANSRHGVFTRFATRLFGPYQMTWPASLTGDELFVLKRFAQEDVISK